MPVDDAGDVEVVFVNIAPADFENGNLPVEPEGLFEEEAGWVKLGNPVGLANPEEIPVPEG